MLRKTFGLLLLVFLVAFQVLANDGVVDPGIQEAANFIRSEAGSHRLILLGEMHGTREAPQLVGELVAAYSSQGPVLLGCAPRLFGRSKESSTTVVAISTRRT